MGKHQSKQHNENGDLHLTTVVRNQQTHDEYHVQQTLLLWSILIVVVIHLAIVLYGLHKKREQRVALKAAKSIAALNVE